MTDMPDYFHEAQRDAAPSCRHCGDSGCEYCRKHANRAIWNNDYAVIFQRKTGCIGQIALDAAEADDDAFNDGMTPEEAVDSELSYWTE